MSTEPSANNAYHAFHVSRLCASYHRWTGRALIEVSDGLTTAEALYRAPFVVLSHGTEQDPIFNYANVAGQELFEMDWAKIITVPSRFSAEPVNREERARLMNAVTEHGYISDYRGVRISATGRRFLIERATVWNVLDESDKRVGQAAMFDHWVPV